MCASDHVYVHVPFCDGKCAYCAFYSVRYTEAAADAYLSALDREMALAQGQGAPPDPVTIYVGGGSPTVLGEDRLRRLGSLVRRRFAGGRLREWTVEAAPGGLSEKKIAALREAGVTRVSLGAQSFGDAVLRRAGRRHTAADVEAAFLRLRAGGFANLGLDLIAGLPGAGPASWRASLQRACALAPQHVSVYGLGVEPGTALHTRIGEGAGGRPPEAALRRALAEAERVLGEARFERYEISNYALLPARARPGAASRWRCEHNVACWAGEDYLGFGPSAASRGGRMRRTNRPDLPDYVRALNSGLLPPREEETLDAATDTCERLMFAFRLREGVDLGAFVRRFGRPAESLRLHWESALARLALLGVAERRGRRWALTPRGRDVADAVALEMLPPDEANNGEPFPRFADLDIGYSLSLLQNSRGRHGGRPSMGQFRPLLGGSGSVPTVPPGVLQEAPLLDIGHASRAQ
jgi:oxygen-independent coproporphyrinogen-3 oxidase